MLPQQAPHVINDAIRRTIAIPRHEPLSARPGGMSAMPIQPAPAVAGSAQDAGRNQARSPGGPMRPASALAWEIMQCKGRAGMRLPPIGYDHSGRLPSGLRSIHGSIDHQCPCCGTAFRASII
jgi:hypothetical protein